MADGIKRSGNIGVISPATRARDAGRKKNPPAPPAKPKSDKRDRPTPDGRPHVDEYA